VKEESSRSSQPRVFIVGLETMNSVVKAAQLGERERIVELKQVFARHAFLRFLKCEKKMDSDRPQRLITQQPINQSIKQTKIAPKIICDHPHITYNSACLF
jgi:hypothetical protein